jgi:hypothetical protein
MKQDIIADVNNKAYPTAAGYVCHGLWVEWKRKDFSVIPIGFKCETRHYNGHLLINNKNSMKDF